MQIFICTTSYYLRTKKYRPTLSHAISCYATSCNAVSL